MPASRKRAGRPMRASRTAKKLVSLALDMEVPLREASDAVHALRLMGYGLEGQGYSPEGRAIADVAWTACQRLDELDDAWRSLCEIVVRRREAGATRSPDRHCRT